MKLIKFFQILAALLLVDFFFFPFRFAWAPPGFNTKLMLATIGLVVMAFSFAKHNRPELPPNLIQMTVWALGVSLTSFAAITINDTPDTTYVTYVVSMFVWLVAAYTAVSAVKAAHGSCTIDVLCNYLVILGGAHCFFALLIDQYPFFANLANAIESGHELIREGGSTREGRRLYSVGVALDTGGIKFSIILVLLAYRIMHVRKEESSYFLFYLPAFIVIIAIGSMISRTTYVGAGIGIAYMAYCSAKHFDDYKEIWRWMAIFVFCAIPVFTYLYNTNVAIHYYLRFGFEGFFNLVENGEWEIGSNEQLKGMIVFPETMKTWIIGDGYMINPVSDPYYTGEITNGYYKDTDIGYLRFIFYSGLIGLLTFSAFMICVAINSIRQRPQYRILFLMLLAVHFLVWLKVSTDCFYAFAMLMFLDVASGNEGDSEGAFLESPRERLLSLQENK